MCIQKLCLTRSSGFDFAVVKESLMMLDIFLREGLNKYQKTNMIFKQKRSAGLQAVLPVKLA